jgi:hypothetical protein
VFAFIAAALVACCAVIGLMGLQTTRLRIELISRWILRTPGMIEVQ